MKVTNPRARWCIAVGAIAFFIAGLALSRRVERGVRVEVVTLTEDTPALRFFPADSSPHPIALLAHGIFCSKETLFRYGEALAAAGFIGYAIDLPGHGESPRRFSLAGNATTLEKVARRLGSVDVFIGYSMGGFAGGEAVRDGGLRPRLFIAVGSVPRLGEHAPPLLLLAGRFDEFVPPAVLKARTEARLVISPWSDHALELYDPRLVDAAVKAACAAVGKTPPAAPTRWRWRLAGMALGLLGMVGMAKVGLMLCVPEVSRRWAHVRGPLFSVTVIGAFALTSGTWLGAVPPLRRVPVQLAAAAMTWLVVMGAGRLGIPRWGFLALAVAVWIGSLVAGASIIVLFAYFFMLALVPGTVIGGIAAHRGSGCDGDIAMAIAVGYALGQWIPRIL